MKIHQIDLKNLSNDIISLTFIFNNSFENKNLNLDNNFKKVLPFLRKSFSQNLQVSFQRLLTLLEIIGHAEITKVYKTDSKNFSIQNHKELKLSKNLLIKTLNLKDYDLNVFKKAGLKPLFVLK